MRSQRTQIGTSQCGWKKWASLRLVHVRRIGPIYWINTAFHVLMKSRKLPVAHAGDVPMFHGVVMHVIEMFLKIMFVANRVLPKSPLPNSAFVVLGAGIVAPFDCGNCAIGGGSDFSAESPGQMQGFTRSGSERSLICAMSSPCRFCERSVQLQRALFVFGV